MTEWIDVTGLGDGEVRALITPEMKAEGELRSARLRKVMDSLEDDTGQTAYSSLLDTCPFCGGRAWVQYWDYPTGLGMEARVVCGGCHASTSRIYQSGRVTDVFTGDDLTKALVLERAVETWNRRAERTARAVVSPGSDGHDVGRVRTMHHACSACGRPIDSSDAYCKHCGARLEDG